jgi:L,D-transpeptidase catalytic domain/Putative peptidoglycan binding domain/PKD domain
VSASATPTSGAAPLQVALTASGDPATYHWDLGDGATADGAAVQHVYAAGRFTAHVTATAADGETARAAVSVTSLALSLAAPSVARYGRTHRFHGRVVPGLKGIRVALYRGERKIGSAGTGRGGRFSLRGPVGTPGLPYTARYGGAVSNALNLAVRPGLDSGFRGSGQIGRPMTFTARVRPATAGKLRVRIWRGRRLVLNRLARGRLRIALSTRRSVSYRALVSLVPARGYVQARRALERIVFVPSLGLGAAGAGVYELDRRLNELHYALGRIDAYYGEDDRDAVIAFQKLHGLPRTGSVDARLWRELEAARVPRPRYAGDHVEVSKERQVLFLVRDGRVALVVPVSTGATGNTPVGVWHVYRRVAGWDWVLWDPTYFVGAFAIHGYPDVPPYPASHGCVRVPMWVASRLFEADDYGTTVYVY